MLFGSRDMLRTIEREALSTGSLATTLRKIVALGGQSGSRDLGQWALRELRGYDRGTLLPPYRQPASPLFIDYITPRGMMTGDMLRPGEWGLEDIDDLEVVHLPMGVGEIEQHIRAARHSREKSIKLHPPAGTDLLHLLNSQSAPGVSIVRVYWSVTLGTLEGVLDQVRTTLVELVAEIRFATPSGQTPAAAVADAAVAIVVYGKRNRVTVNAATTGSGDATVNLSPADTSPRFSTLTKSLFGSIVGLATIAGAWLAYLTYVK
jgi:hypothetical protein